MSTGKSCITAPVSAANDLTTIIESKNGAWQCQEFADLLGVSAKYVYDQVKRGSLPAYRLGGMLRINPKAVATWLRSRSTVAEVAA
jgi:excisionase family DNA binding protein